MNSSLPTVAQVLRDSAGYIARHGYYAPTSARDNYAWSDACVESAASDVGAIAFVIYGQPVQMPTPEPTAQFALFRQAVNAYVDWLELGDPEDTGIVPEPDNADDLADAFDQAASLWESRNPGGHQ